MAQVFFNSFFFGSRFLCVRSVHKPFFSSAHDQDINSLKVHKKGGCNIPNTIMYILVLPNPCIINYDSNIFPRSSQTCTLSLVFFSSTVEKIQNFSKTLNSDFSHLLRLKNHYCYSITPIVISKGRVISESIFNLVPSVKSKTKSLSFIFST